MTKLIPLILATFLLVVPATVGANGESLFRVSGPVDFRKVALSDEAPFIKDLSAQPVIKLKWYRFELGRRRKLLVGLHTENTLSKQLWVDYHVAFFDKDENLVASYSQDATLEAKSTTYLGSCILNLSPSQILDYFL